MQGGRNMIQLKILTSVDAAKAKSKSRKSKSKRIGLEWKELEILSTTSPKNFLKLISPHKAKKKWKLKVKNKSLINSSKASKKDLKKEKWKLLNLSMILLRLRIKLDLRILPNKSILTQSTINLGRNFKELER